MQLEIEKVGSNKRSLVILILGLLSAIGPFSIDTYLSGFPIIANDLHVTVDKVSYSLSSFFIGISLGQLIYGPLLDRFGRKKILGLSIAGTALGYVLFAVGIITRNLPLLFFSRAFDGITGGNLSVAQAVIADISAPQDRTKNFAKIGAAFGIGFVMGPYLGAKLATPNLNFFGLFHTPHWFNPATPFWFTAILSAINVLLILFLLPETHEHMHDAKIKLTQSVQNIVKAATLPGLRVIFPSIFSQK